MKINRRSALKTIAALLPASLVGKPEAEAVADPETANLGHCCCCDMPPESLGLAIMKVPPGDCGWKIISLES